ncbi:bifunctional adenosylcobinamide kinase/adenosylcobinamide-phosphate guanylyltransferase [Anaerolentibacter hominis]|uniref:bifunctional adenosylcobinamide kinase/adenosylcobinamide-phosphate guanylyltransferase n=1 Tax=Anaerolentibacter hominis TaxID=3079009 RepID=UPI0031B88649
MILIVGGSGSGKSEYAEQVLIKRAEQRRYYVATMRPEGREAEARIVRHRMMRRDKGFTTLEAPEHLSVLSLPAGAGVLLECVSNLLANEMFGEKEHLPADRLCACLVEDILRLNDRCRELVVVSGDVFSSGECYEEETMQYISCLGQMNRALAEHAECVVEVVCGIPCVWKGELP